MVTDGEFTYCGEQGVPYGKNHWSICYMTKTNITLYVNYTSMKTMYRSWKILLTLFQVSCDKHRENRSEVGTLKDFNANSNRTL